MKISHHLTLLVGIILFTVILLYIDLGETLKVLGGISPLMLVLLILLRIGYVIMKSFAWRCFLKAKKISFSLKESVRAYSAGLLLGMVTPGRIGDVIRVGYLKEKSVPIKKSLGTVIIDRVFDLSLLFSLGYISMMTLPDIFGQDVTRIGIIAGIVAAIGAIVLLSKKHIEKIIIVIIRKATPKRLNIRAEKEFKELFRECTSFEGKWISIGLGASLLSWLIYYVQMYIGALALGISVSFVYIIVVISVAGLVNLIPLSVSGIGTRDIAFIILFGLIGVSKEVAVSYSLLYLFLIVVGAGVGFFYWMKHPIKISY